MYNADILLGVVGSTLGRVKSLAPVVRMAMAYPLRGLFRTGVTLAMFTLVVFTLVVGATTTGSFVHAVDDVNVIRRRLRRQRDDLADGSDRQPASQAIARTPVAACHGLPARLEPVDAADQGAAARDGTAGRVVHRQRRRSTPSSPTRRTGSRPGHAAIRPQRGMEAPCATIAGSRSSIRTWCRGERTGGRPRHEVPAERLVRRGQDVRTGAHRRARSANRHQSQADGDRRPLGPRAAADGGDLDVAAIVAAHSSTACSRPRSSSSCAQESIRRRRLRSSSPAFLANGMQAES